MRYIVFPLIFGLIFVSAQCRASELSAQTAARFRQIEMALTMLKQRETFKFASIEVQEAQSILKQGYQLLKSRQYRQAAILAEQLPVVLDIIRLKMELGEIQKKALQEQNAILRLTEQVKVLKLRKSRFLSKQRGASATMAYPSIKEGK